MVIYIMCYTKELARQVYRKRMMNVLSSTSPQRSIWLLTSTVAAKAACSTVRWLDTNARAMISDFEA